MATGANDSNGIYQYGPDDVLGADWSAGPLAQVPQTVSARFNELLALRTTTQPLANSAFTTVTFDSTPPRATLPGGFTPSTGLFVASVAGLYKVTARLDFAGNNSGNRIVQIQQALAATPTTFTQVRSQQLSPISSAVDAQVTVTDFVQLAIGDVLRIQGEQTSGGSLNVIQAQLEIALA